MINYETMTQEQAQVRVQIKRQLRKLAIEFDKTESTESLQAKLDNAQKPQQSVKRQVLEAIGYSEMYITLAESAQKSVEAIQFFVAEGWSKEEAIQQVLDRSAYGWKVKEIILANI